jgi:hypothetical protein
MSILIIFFTVKQNGGYNRKLPASLQLTACLNLILTRPVFISVFSPSSILCFSSSFISSRTRRIGITINIRDTTLDMDWSYVSINFSWSVLKYYNETMSSWTLMWFESMMCCVVFSWGFFLLLFFFLFSVFFCLFFFVEFVLCALVSNTYCVVFLFCFVCLRLIFCDT